MKSLFEMDGFNSKPKKVKQTPFEMDGFNSDTRFYVTKDFRDHFKKGDVIRLFDDDGSTIPHFICDETGKMAYLSYRPMIEFGFIRVFHVPKQPQDNDQTPFEKSGFNSDTRFYVTKDFYNRFKERDVIRLLYDDGSLSPNFICDRTGERSRISYQIKIDLGFILVLPEQKQSQVKQTPFERDGFNSDTRFLVTEDFCNFKKGDVIRLLIDNGIAAPVFICDETGEKSICAYLMALSRGYIRVFHVPNVVPGPKQPTQIQTNNNTFWYIGNGQVVFEEPAKKRMVADEPIPESPDFTSKKHLWDF